MTKRLRLFAVACAIAVGVPIGHAAAASAPAGVAISAARTAPRAQYEDYKTSVDRRPIPKTARCPQFWDEARQIGWKEADLKVLDFIIWRESRCNPRAHNTTKNADGSTDMGLVQINDRSWCLPNRFNKKGYLQKQGIIQYCEDLFNPVVNLTAAKALYDYSKENGSGFRPWGL